MYRRKIVSQLIKKLQEPRQKIQVVVGPRQTGKTMSVLLALSEIDMPIHFASADDLNLRGEEWLYNEWEQARALTERGEAILSIDDFQKLSAWSPLVIKLWEEDTANGTPLKVVLTGSSSLQLTKEFNGSLKDYSYFIRSPHWSYAECRAAFDYSLEDYLFYGGYPGAAVLNNDDNNWARYISSSVIEVIVAQDILLQEEVRKPLLLRSLLTLGSLNSSEEISLTKLLSLMNDTGNTTTLAHYLDFLAKANTLIGLPKFSGESIRNRGGAPRLMVYDTALLSYAEGTNRRRLLENPIDRGRLIESAVGAFLLARGSEEDFQVYWWRERSFEVDFVIQKGNYLTAIEVKSGKPKSLNGFQTFKKRYPDAHSLIIGGEDNSLEDFLLGEIPLWR